MAKIWSSRTEPDKISLIDMKAVRPRLSGISRFVILITLALSILEGRAAEPERMRDIVYGRKAGMGLILDVLKPSEPNGIGVIFMVSGGFTSDIGILDSGIFKIEAFRPFLDRGQTVFLVCHSSQPKFTVPEIIPDIHRAVRFIRTHAAKVGVDPNRLAVTGASSGGFLTLSLATGGKAGDPSAQDPVDRESSRVGAAACFFPPADLVNYGETNRTFLEYKPVQFVWHTVPVKDKPEEEKRKALREISPLYAISSNTAPTLIITGNNDALVPHEQSERFIARLKELGVPSKLVIREGAGHGWANMEKDWELFAEWFEQHLKK